MESQDKSFAYLALLHKIQNTNAKKKSTIDWKNQQKYENCGTNKTVVFSLLFPKANR